MVKNTEIEEIVLRVRKEPKGSRLKELVALAIALVIVFLIVITSR